jgi:very-short-patch-repair endonuclease
MIKDGKFSQIKSKPHIKFQEILKELNIDHEEEKILDVWCFDFYVSKCNIYVEVDGDYFHSNPKFYPNGPKTNTQKINWYRDIKKSRYCLENNLKLLRFWECDILNNPEEIKCKLKELLV